MKDQILFHLAIPINDIEQAKKFYCLGLGCVVGRETSQAIILNFYGNQVVAHMTKETLVPQKGIYPRHFGLIFPHLNDWEHILTQAQTNQLDFYEPPKLRFEGKLTEHRTFFLQDPFFNLLEFKFYSHSVAIFGGREISEIGDRL
jgi:hypothetical protein